MLQPRWIIKLLLFYDHFVDLKSAKRDQQIIEGNFGFFISHFKAAYEIFFIFLPYKFDASEMMEWMKNLKKYLKF